MADDQNDATSTATTAAEQAMERGNAVSMRLLDQAEVTARETFAALRAAARAKDVTEVMKIQSDFLREQSTRNMQHAREMSELILQYGRDAVTPFTGRKPD
ncbi:phasin family protein [Sphingomonas aracearum]|uniref:Phasin family protein n=1 Tax=Sphingomonas aracearum TaxID=2283317 RepID=A0A369VSS3_9SPHN|nr:phasin family protein [Sphingomonas aracearum]RDE05456.1 phasin family protein [Sphingomonas aracearum]